MTSEVDLSTRAHFNADVDFTTDSHHHTLGPGQTQASPGDHDHSGGRNGILIPQGSVVNLIADLATKSPTTHNHDTLYAAIAHSHAYTDVNNYDTDSANLGDDLVRRFRHYNETGAPTSSSLTNCTFDASTTVVRPESTANTAKMYVAALSYTLNANAANAVGTVTLPTGIFTAAPIVLLTLRIATEAYVSMSSPTTTSFTWRMRVFAAQASAVAFLLNVLAVGR